MCTGEPVSNMLAGILGVSIGAFFAALWINLHHLPHWRVERIMDFVWEHHEECGSDVPFERNGSRGFLLYPGCTLVLFRDAIKTDGSGYVAYREKP